MDNCCLNILTEYNEVKFNIAMTLDSESGVYSFTLYDNISGSVDVIMYYSESAGSWYISNQSNPNIVYYYFDSEYVCPLNSVHSKIGETDWIAQEELPINIGDFDNFVIYPVPCSTSGAVIPETVDPVECDPVPCKYTHLLKKQKSSLSKDIAKISKREVFGLDCGGDWESLFKRSLIIDALSCIPYGVLSNEQEQCLIGKLNEKCNC